MKIQDVAEKNVSERRLQFLGKDEVFRDKIILIPTIVRRVCPH